MGGWAYECEWYTLKAGGEKAIEYRARGWKRSAELDWPVFEVDGENVAMRPREMRAEKRRRVAERTEEVTLKGDVDGGIQLTMTLRVCEKTPFIRFRYALGSPLPHRLTKEKGQGLTYFACQGEAEARRTEVRLSTYDNLLHGYCLDEIPAFAHEDEAMGPILTEERDGGWMLTAYEHGSMYPDKFVAFYRTEDGVALKAVKGNYWAGQRVDKGYETIWLQMGGVAGSEEDLSRAYRTFELEWCSPNRESRKPYIFYNTWAFQERNRFYNRQNYLTSMNRERMEKEIEIAHRMGVDVFVIDTGWYEKTGDWETDKRRFPEGMERIRDMLSERGMKLGLWFGPTSAAKSSKVYKSHMGCRAALRGKEPVAFPIWETEESWGMCLASEYWEAFADQLIYLARTVGVRYFKWDGVDMYGCSMPGHFHGDESTSEEECHDSFRFQVGLYMSKVVDRLCEAVPDAIVDMDVTEGRRYFGLGFLSSGKFFSLNNGPYYQSYDIKMPEDVWSNVFVNPGPARTWICRQNLAYDKWIPSVVMMAHYLPDDPQSSQMINLASLVLGQNGIWGDLAGVSEEGVERIGQVLSVYKRVREDITRAYPVVYGRPGETFEAHEKIFAGSGRGVVCLFANQAGEYRYRMSARTDEEAAVFGPAKVKRDRDGVWIEAKFTESGAAMAFFGGRG